ncbi:hypothetical protein M407DRAFT_169944 [Tulasnella calospora MUT 4182]|uniref:Uncharacterized protein n=1 Tax=Tulasnella calospora MUT 4182 TaxID=1051891 RepID=A0A0C3L6F5_9AGAM|nr:hypothetical protein M407DRAFT_169944 [Tulasnella calospora MUT 4182]
MCCGVVGRNAVNSKRKPLRQSSSNRGQGRCFRRCRSVVSGAGLWCTMRRQASRFVLAPLPTRFRLSRSAVVEFFVEFFSLPPSRRLFIFFIHVYLSVLVSSSSLVSNDFGQKTLLTRSSLCRDEGTLPFHGTPCRVATTLSNWRLLSLHYYLNLVACYL